MKFQESVVLFCILISVLECGYGHPYIDVRKTKFRSYPKSWGHGEVRLGLGNTLPENTRTHKIALLRAMIQRLKVALKMSAVQEAFKREEVDKSLNIVPPANKAEVAYDSGVSAELGNTLTPTLVKDQPTVTWPAEEGAFYTVLLTDPDAPSREDPKWGEWRHWLVVNIPGNNVGAGEVAVEYIGAGPPKDTGLHRYCILVFKQSGRVTYTDPKLGLSTKDRNNTKTTDLVAKYNLGDPVAGNFFKAEYDDYVPKLYASLKG